MISITTCYGTTTGLVLCLSNEDPNIILISLEALKYLAMYTPNRPVMKNHMGMIQSLQVSIFTPYLPNGSCIKLLFPKFYLKIDKKVLSKHFDTPIGIK